MTRWLAEHRTCGLPEPPMLPHPDHLIIDPVAGSVVLRGPRTEEMKGHLGSADGDASRPRRQDLGRKDCLAEAGEECATGRGTRGRAERRPEDRRLPRQLRVDDRSRSRRIGPEVKHTKAARHLRARRCRPDRKGRGRRTVRWTSARSRASVSLSRDAPPAPPAGPTASVSGLRSVGGRASRAAPDRRDEDSCRSFPTPRRCCSPPPPPAPIGVSCPRPRRSGSRAPRSRKR